MRSNGQKKKIRRVKTGRLERQWSVTKAGMTAGTTAATQIWGSAFLSKSKRKARNKRILSDQANYLAEQLGELKGSVVKVGQIMALYGEHVLPQEVTDAFRTLEEKTIPLDWPAIERALKNELGPKLKDFEVEREPIGAASLAQVHRAVHKPTKQWVVLKVQYPGVAEAIDSDLNAVVRLLKLSRMIAPGQPFKDWVAEVRALLHYEVNYDREIAVTQHFGEMLKDDPVFSVPTILEEYCTEKLIVSSYETGCSVMDEEVMSLSQDVRNHLGAAFLELFIKEVFDWGEIQTDPNFGNYRIQIDDKGQAKIVLLDFGAVLQYPDSFLSPLKQTILAAKSHDFEGIKAGAIALGIMQEAFPEEVHQDFAKLCELLIEPFVMDKSNLPDSVLNEKGEYRWAYSRLPKRAAKHAAKSAVSKYFAVPPKEFAFLSRKLLGVYSFIAALEAEFNPGGLLEKYSD